MMLLLKALSLFNPWSKVWDEIELKRTKRRLERASSGAPLSLPQETKNTIAWRREALEQHPFRHHLGGK